MFLLTPACLAGLMVAITCVALSEALPAEHEAREKRQTSSADQATKNWMKKYGYGDDGPSQDFTASKVNIGILNIQRMYGLPQTGVMDYATRKAMNDPRCGMSDKESLQQLGKRRKRFALQGSKWPKNSLTYSINRYTPDLSRPQVDTTITQAFQMWADVTPLTFAQRSAGQRVDIVILFAGGNHGDGNSFDSAGGTLAHAYFPQYGGDAHFDEAETWTLDVNRGINLLQVATHEFGHSLGLLHSNVRASIMYPSYRGFIANFRLDTDDINGIQRNYGRNTGPPSATPPPPTPPRPTPPPATPPPPTPPPATRPPRTPPTTRRTRPAPPPTRPTQQTPPPVDPSGQMACDVTKWDAVITATDGVTYFFSGSNFYRHDKNNGAASRTPYRISSSWPGVPDNIEAAINYLGYSIFFKGPDFYLFRYDRRTRRHNRIGSSRQVWRRSTYFPGLVDNMDAAWIYPRNRKLYVTKSEKYWRYNGRSRYYDRFYPRISGDWWHGTPSTLDAADTYDRSHIYFFKGSSFYDFDIKADKVVGGPQNWADVWFGCSNTVSGAHFSVDHDPTPHQLPQDEQPVQPSNTGNDIGKEEDDPEDMTTLEEDENEFEEKIEEAMEGDKGSATWSATSNLLLSVACLVVARLFL